MKTSEKKVNKRKASKMKTVIVEEKKRNMKDSSAKSVIGKRKAEYETIC